MSGLRERLDELVEDVPVYGDLDRAIARAAHARRRTAALVAAAASVAAVLALVAGGLAVTRDRADAPQPAGPPTTTPTTGTALSALADGPVTPGRYRYVVRDTCDAALGCPADARRALPDIAVTVPAGWTADNGYHLIEPDGPNGTHAPDGAGLVLGWTNTWVGVYSRPCRRDHAAPDVTVGPTVDDFVDAVTAHPLLDVSEPEPVELGGYRGRFLTLTGPPDLTGCVEWRPWDPSPYSQGPGNTWDLWVMDVDGTRVVVMAGYYPGTPATTRTELREMAESIRFLPTDR